MTLAAKLDAIREQAGKRIPAEALAKMHRATEELRNSGLVEQALGVGDPLPGFSLKSDSGQLLGSAELLAGGPLVLSFYRGVW
ncbi:thioredoxin domain-containing protein [Desulfogranum mediterraneum]|uniref:hypothetical protein n=1 Tax=Desulfogranum mediterraneum TaxID=160661 RepID=UPI001ABF17B7|nr:hypothetical protein [Desulfogranum mediterraneum]